jgi:Zn-dependent protease with chaperone function
MLIEKLCPRCGAVIAADQRFVVWCQACEWNADPRPRKRLQFIGKLAARGSDRLAQRLRADELSHQHARRGGVVVATLAWLLAAVIHLLTIGLVAGAVAWLDLSSGVPTAVRLLVAAFGLGVAAFVQPFRRRPPPGGPVLSRAAAPELFALIDEVAAASRTPTVDHIVIGPDYNASYLKLSPRRPTIAIGLALWAALDPSERVALLGHELAHRVNADLRRDLVVSGALATLANWQLLLLPAQPIWKSRGKPLPAVTALTHIADQVLAPLILIPPFLVVQVIGIALARLVQRQGERGEYYADDLAATAAGTRAAVGLVHKLLVAESCWRVVVQTLRFQRDADPWLAVIEYVRSMPLAEWERLRLLGRRELHRIDSAHPPTQFRADVLNNRPDRPGVVVMPAVRAAAIDAELAQARADLANDLRARVSGPGAG